MQYDFKELKSRVGVTDIAIALGYRIDRKAGIGRYVELALGEGGSQDRIIVSFPNDKSRQTFFRRNGSKGDVLDLIKENIDSFNVTGRNIWERTAKVMMQQANIPVDISQAGMMEEAAMTKEFDPERYKTVSIDASKKNAVLQSRGFTSETVAALSPFISLIRDNTNEKFKGYNIGFPYTEGFDGKVCGYEIRGANGYKQKAAGTNSSTGAWVADLAKVQGKHPSEILFFESAFDAMAFYQANSRINDLSHTALVSLGGTFSDGQIRKIIEQHPQSRLVDCFDNDKAGRIYGLRLLALVNNKPVQINHTDEGLVVEWGSQEIKVPESKIDRLTDTVAQTADIDRHTGEWRAPKYFKDWNDFILGKKMEDAIEPTKHQRNQNLEERRKGGMKL